ncbi:hypothetical protein CU633_19010 [Bacillus sp. V3-13]|uniref:hypothetical protein n=1 Tax=Bacillus sp. V3-13 TaxID=2053728 RepID=UPI000C78A82C|nr:hypothetical protein [Bacillus sp. V3-13]PLR75810.1 hypothetical protein CU633_19010 [Bacillus sp. V3-13]
MPNENQQVEKMAEIKREETKKKVITAIKMYHFCHVFYQPSPLVLPLIAKVFTKRYRQEMRIYKVKDFER